MKKTMVFLVVWFLAYLAIAAITLVANFEHVSYVQSLNNAVVWQIAIILGWIPAAIAASEIKNPR